MIDNILSINRSDTIRFKPIKITKNRYYHVYDFDVGDYIYVIGKPVYYKIQKVCSGWKRYNIIDSNNNIEKDVYIDSIIWKKLNKNELRLMKLERIIGDK